VKISLVIPSYEREKILCNTIKYALGQDFIDYEVLVIDQTKNHTAETKEFLKRLPSRIRVIDHQPPSLTGARNRGILEATGEIIIMIDDDVILRSDFISQHAKYYDDGEIVAVAGRVEQEKRFCGRIPSFIRSEFIQWLTFSNFESLKEQDAYRVVGCNFSFRKESAVQAGFFDENFVGDAWGEEYDFSLRIKGPGCKIVYAPNAVVIHLSARSGGCRKRERFRSYETVYSKPHNLAYIMEKHRLKKWYYLYLVWYVYRLSFMKREYLSLRGLQFILKGHPHYVRGFMDGFKKGRIQV
jgi:GT2 family glycosyltransferase